MESSVLGPIPPDAVMFKIHKKLPRADGKEGSSWQSQLAPAVDGEGASVPNFPIAALSLDGIRAAFGPGTYRVDFFAFEEGKFRHLKFSPVFELGAERASPRAFPAPPPPPPPPPPVAPVAIPDSMMVLQLAQMLARDQIAAMAATHAQSLAFLQAQSTATAQMMAQHYNAMLRVQRTDDSPILRELAELRRIVEYEDEPEAAPAPPAPTPGIIGADGQLSGLHVLLKAIEKVPDALQMVQLWAEAKKAPPPQQHAPAPPALPHDQAA